MQHTIVVMEAAANVCYGHPLLYDSNTCGKSATTDDLRCYQAGHLGVRGDTDKFIFLQGQKDGENYQSMNKIIYV